MTSVLERIRSFALRGKGRRFVAIDFDSRHVRMAHAERSGDRLRVLKLATFDVPADVDVASVEALGALVGEKLRSLGWRGASVVMSVPRGQSVLKPVMLPPGVGQAEVAGMVQYQMEKELPFAPEDAVIDFSIESHYDAEVLPEEATNPGLGVLVAAVQRPVVEQYRRLAGIAGFRLVRLGLRPYADARCVEACTVRRPEECLALVHVTADGTEIDIIASGAMVFSRAAVVKIPRPAADENGAVDQAVDAVVVEVARSLRSYQAVHGGRVIDALLVAGGTGIEPRVARDLATRLDIPCRMLDPTPGLGLEPVEGHASAYLSVLGLAIGHAGSAEPPFDFLRPKRPAVRRDRRKILIGAVGGGVAAVLIGSIATGTLFLQGKQARVNTLSVEFRKFEEQNKRVAAVGKPVKAIETWVGAGRPWLDHWAYLSDVFPPCTEVYVTALSANQDGYLSFAVKARSSGNVVEYEAAPPRGLRLHSSSRLAHLATSLTRASAKDAITCPRVVTVAWR
jgi:Tfp pilus assembly PilM family ATPase